ncbi:uncharacterized protein LOC113359040 [Papaver somniferum]|uniref:uncharacterized protein LOC113359040 n=1 Tax=Papaver somniferum TaxID=3469 RepID=UPI000E6FDFA7|nr:uncharacterized protein LOC113359040 [Papaver somniferum]
MDTSQRIKIFTWKFLQNTLPTREKLGSVLDVETQCIFCKHAIESTYHVFFDYSYAQAVWNLPPMASQGVNYISNNTSFLGKYNEWLTGDINSVSMALAATKCWFIWKERCLRVFEKQERTPEQLVVDITRQFAYWHPQTLNSDTTQPRIKTVMLNPWNFPAKDTLKLNCDASWVSKYTDAGFGCVLRNWLGTGKEATMGVFRASTTEEAEALPLLHTTRWANQNNLHKLVIEGDNQLTINYLQGKSVSVQWQSVPILEEVKSESSKLVYFFGL